MKTAISISDTVFRSAEQLAARLGMSRSELYCTALAELIEKHRDDLVTSRLNNIFTGAGLAGEGATLEPEISLLQHRSRSRKKR